MVKILKWAIVLTGIVVLSIFQLQAQDRQFSQFYANPLYLSPALTGAFQGSYRANLNYRDQWRPALGTPLATFSISADLSFDITNKGGFFGNDRFGAGIQFFSDKKEGFDFNTNYINLFGAFHKSLDPNSNQTLSLGFQGGITQKNINFGNLTFQDQFVDGSGFVLGSREDINTNNFAFGDFAIGLNYSIQPSDELGIVAGFSLHHIFEPNISFYQDLEDDQLISNTELLDRKYSFYGMSEILMSSGVTLLPRFFIAQQGNHFALNLGSNLKFFINEDKSNSFYIGAWGRMTNQLDALGLESITLFTGLGFGEFLLGLSYDSNTSAISDNITKRGVFELSLYLIGNYSSDGIFCPTF